MMISLVGGCGPPPCFILVTFCKYGKEGDYHHTYRSTVQEQNRQRHAHALTKEPVVVGAIRALSHCVVEQEKFKDYDIVLVEAETNRTSGKMQKEERRQACYRRVDIMHSMYGN